MSSGWLKPPDTLTCENFITPVKAFVGTFEYGIKTLPVRSDDTPPAPHSQIQYVQNRLFLFIHQHHGTQPRLHSVEKQWHEICYIQVLSQSDTYSESGQRRGCWITVKYFPCLGCFSLCPSVPDYRLILSAKSSDYTLRFRYLNTDKGVTMWCQNSPFQCLFSCVTPTLSTDLLRT